MKQWRHDQKVINWHAPRKAGALCASYIAKRTHGFQSLKQVDAAEADFCVYCKGWSCYDEDEGVMRCRRLSSLNYDIFDLADGTEEFVDRSDFLCELNRKNIERKFAFSNPILLPLEMVEEANEALFDKQEGPRRIQESDLAGHFHNLKTAEQNPSLMEFDPRDVLRIKNALCPDPEFPATRDRPSISKNLDATFVALFLGYSIRSLSQFKAISGDAPKDFPSLAEYLFCHYPIPQWLKAVWKNPKMLSSGDLNQALKWAYWFICLGQGGSLRKLATLMGGR
ncbi:MAG: hypothetical protein EBS01_06890, partial [Verrucomicrobia bacterium]|nr:hypothetical protein [Verrucomicrobiota bacterium]